MNSVYIGLVTGCIEEIECRAPEYLARFPLIFPWGRARADRWARHPVLKHHDQAVLGPALEVAVQQIRQRGLQVTFSESFEEPVSLVVFDGILDALAADIGLVSLKIPKGPAQPAAQILEEQYERRSTPDGRSYLVRRRGKHPLLLINALGIPLGVWAKLLGDDTHDFRIMIVETRCCDVLEGGMGSDASLALHAGDIVTVLDHERIQSFHTLAWCNGGRIAIDLATRRTYDVQSLTLLSPTLRGTRAGLQTTSPFEDKLQEVFTTVTKKEALAKPLVTMLNRFASPPDWDGLADNLAARSGALFAMPAREHASAFLRPMSTGPYLLNYARRTAADETYPMVEALSRLAAASTPVLLVLGSHDAMIDNGATRTALSACGVQATEVTVSGAGHYVQQLQYPYLLWLLENFTARHEVPLSTLRAGVTLARSRELADAST